MALRAVDLGDPGAIGTAAAAIAAGEAVAVDNDAVWAIWGDARQPSFHEQIRTIKGEARSTRPVALSVPSAWFVDWVDVAAVAAPWRPLLSDAELLRSLLGALCFVRVPLRTAAAPDLPREAIGGDADPTIQNYDPDGKANTARLVAAVVSAAPRALPAVTSLNRTGERSITDEAHAAELLSRRSPATLLVTDRGARRRGLGSYPMIAVGRTGATVLRHGCVPDAVLAAILRPVVTDPLHGVAPDAGPEATFPEVGRELRTAYLRYRGWAAD